MSTHVFCAVSGCPERRCARFLHGLNVDSIVFKFHSGSLWPDAIARRWAQAASRNEAQLQPRPSPILLRHCETSFTVLPENSTSRKFDRRLGHGMCTGFQRLPMHVEQLVESRPGHLSAGECLTAHLVRASTGKHEWKNL